MLNIFIYIYMCTVVSLLPNAELIHVLPKGLGQMWHGLAIFFGGRNVDVYSKDFVLGVVEH